MYRGNNRKNREMRLVGRRGSVLEEGTEVLDVVLAAETVVEVVDLETDLDNNQVDDDELKIHFCTLRHDGDEGLSLVGQVVQFAIEDDDPFGDVQSVGDVLMNLLETGLTPVDVWSLHEF